MKEKICKIWNNEKEDYLPFFVLHSEKTKRIIFRTMCPNGDMMQWDFHCCPVCGFSYQPERSKREDDEKRQ